MAQSPVATPSSLADKPEVISEAGKPAPAGAERPGRLAHLAGIGLSGELAVVPYRDVRSGQRIGICWNLTTGCYR